jgi:ATP-dependent RNA helicase SUPV3L1/SUV3
VAQQIQQLSKEDRRRLRAVGLRLGRETAWLPTLGGRGSRRLLMRLHAIHAQSQSPTRSPVDTGPDLTGDMVKLAQPVGELALAAAGYRAINGHAIAFDRLERLSERVYRLSEQGALKWDAALAAALEVPQDLIRPLLNEMGYVADGKREEESYKRRRYVRAAPVPPPDPNSPFSVLARLRDTPR